jgi:type I restriction enzyme S subunit
VFYFHKKKEGKDVLETKLKHSKTTQKETERTYVFGKTHQTHNVKFYDYNTENDTKHLLLEVAIEDLAKNNYSLNYAEYLKDETADEVYEDGVVVKTLGEVCSIDYGTRIVKGNNTEGEYPVYGSGRAMFSTTTFNREGYNILIGRFALSLECVRFITDTIFLNDSGLSVKPKDTKILLHKYVGYYLYENQNIIYECARGTAQKNLDMDKFRAIKIPIPPLDRQQEIVKYLDFIYEKCIKTSTEKILELKQLNEFCLNTQKVFGENSVKMLGEVCDVNPETMKTGKYTTINYIDIASVKEGILSEVKTLTSDFPSRAKRVIKQGDILYSSVRPNLKGYVFIDNVIENGIASTGFAQIRVKDKNAILPKFMYYMLTLESILEVLVGKAKGAQYPAVSFTDFETLKIPIPSLERQKEIVDYCEFNDTLIQQLEKEIELNKKQASLFISGIVKTVIVVESVPTTPIAEEDTIVEEVSVVEEAPKPKKLVKKLKLKVIPSDE